MITGDHPITAAKIAMELGIATNDRAIIGSELQKLSDEALAQTVREVSVFARVNPEHSPKRTVTSVEAVDAEKHAKLKQLRNKKLRASLQVQRLWLNSSLRVNPLRPKPNHGKPESQYAPADA